MSMLAGYLGLILYIAIFVGDALLYVRVLNKYGSQWNLWPMSGYYLFIKYLFWPPKLSATVRDGMEKGIPFAVAAARLQWAICMLTRPAKGYATRTAN